MDDQTYVVKYPLKQTEMSKKSTKHLKGVRKVVNGEKIVVLPAEGPKYVPKKKRKWQKIQK